MIRGFTVLVGLMWVAVAVANEPELVSPTVSDCMAQALVSADGATTVDALKAACANEDAEPLLAQRYEEQLNESPTESILIPHWRNYLLPFTYNSNPNQDPYQIAGGDAEPLDSTEIKFQLSIKTPLWRGVFADDDQLYFGMTLTSWWQAYNSDISAPFRETNYSPEVFWVTPVRPDYQFLGVDYFAAGFIHQSNGRSNLFSRSWNRVYVQMFWEHNRWAFMLKPWWRIEEEAKDDPMDADGDDNPDITKYMGYFEAGAVYRGGKAEYGIMWRNNLREDNKGAVQLDWSYPLHEQLRVYVQYFNGYGESLIDYDASVNRIGIGLLLNTLI